MKFFDKILNFFKRLFSGKENQKLLEGKIEQELENNNLIEEENNEKQNSGKEYYKELYNNYKAGKIPKDRILITDFIKMYDMMRVEQEVVQEKISKLDEEIKNQEEKITELKKQIPAEGNN